MSKNNTPPEPEPETGIIVDERTEQVIPRGVSQETGMVIQQAELDLSKIGTLPITADAKAVLNEPLNEKEVLIRPDGMIYVDWTWYADRLNRAFGKGTWALIPTGIPLAKENGTAVEVVWPHWLVIKGYPMGMAIGDCTYFPKNRGMNYADACEGAKSISLARNCKIFGMTLELWDKEWIEAWKAKHAETYKEPKDSNKILWRKKAVDPLVLGRKQFVEEVKEWYPDKKAIADTLMELGLVYSLETHSEVKRKLIDHYYTLFTPVKAQE